MRLLIFCASLLLALGLFYGLADGVQLIGCGTPTATDALAQWAKSYRYTRDDITFAYRPMESTPGVITYATGQADFLGLNTGIPKVLLDYYALSQFPIVGQALVMAYNISTLPSSRSLVLDRNTLGLIWAGNITTWNDPRITSIPDNAGLTFPAELIKLAYDNGDNTSLTEVVRLGLESFSPDFKKVLNSLQVNRSMELLPPAVDGRATLTTMYDADRVAFLQRTPNSMAYMSWSSAVAANLSYIDLYNRAGTLVEASRSSVQAAMASVTGRVSAGDISVNIVDANGTNSWPLAYLFYVTLNQNTVVHQCSLVNDLIEFVAWILSNDAASDEADAYYFVPIDVSLRKTVIDAISQVKCKGERALQANYLIGSGSSLSLFTSWSVLRTSSTNKMKYFQSSSTSAKQQLVKSDLHYGVVADGLSQEWRNNMTDAELMPAVVFALVPAYNLPNLPEQLVLDYKTIALIFMNEITMWNDTRIKSLNSVNVSAALPNASITVVTTSVPSSYTLLFTTALARMAPEIFTITPGDLVNFPVDADRTIGVTSNAEALTAFSNPYTFGFWTAYEATLSRVLGSAAIRKEGNYTVSVSGDSLRSALRDYLPQVSSTTNPPTTPMTTTSSLRARGEPDLTYGDLILMPSKESWPFAAFASFIYRSQNMTDCSRAQTLADFFYWSQTSEAAASTASGSQGLVLATSEDYLWRRFLGQLKSFTCQGQPVSNVYNCINEGQLCSGAGQCTNNACVCNTNREGQYCQNIKASDDNLGVILGVTIPVSLVLACVLLSVILLLLFLARRGGKKTDDWEINYSELDVGEPLGSGGFGAVHKATWKGTEVAVKVIASEKITRDIERAFKDEVRVMTSLRHPNVVLFMAASTKAPNFCIVMEFMALGSLYDLLHNELIPEIPFALKAKMAYQASKGMHFLHSSGIVHRDLKSLNLLLDNKWNAKVSDFGLTRFKEEVKGTGKDIVGSVHWAAPEILNESPGVDLILADVYSFGIILWELLTREQPYFGLSPAAVAVAVIRDGIRPRMPEEPGACPAEYEELIRAAWHQDPTVRPTFLEIMTRLSAMHGESSASNTGLSFTSKTSTSSSGHSTGKDLAKNAYSSWTLPSTNGSISTGSSSSSGGSKHMSGVQTSPDGSRPPEGELAIVFTDITRAASLWEFNAAAMRDATLLHNQALREALVRHRGYEVVFLKDRNSGEGSFCMAFQQAADAVAWCCEVQRALLDVEWPEALLSHPGAAEEWGDTDDRVLFKGLRVRMGIHVGTPRLVRDPMTRRVEYIGPVVNAAARITAMTHGGQILVSHTAHRALLKAISEVGTTPAGGTTPAPALTIDKSNIVKLGTFEMPDAPTGSKLYEIKVPELAGRFFGGVTKDGNSDNGTPSSGSEEREAEAEAAGSMSSDEHFNPRRGGQRQAVQTMVGEGMMFKEDTFLTSANLCRWIIDFGEIQVGKQVGLGSYGVVYRGKWKGVDVAVKRFIKQKLDERRMLEFRAEMAFLSELHHPNIVLFVGACVKRPNLCIVTEFMKQGSLKDILSDNAIKLTWQQKLRLLRGAALGINYLHSLQPVIVHRDLKPSNLLVDETWNVKVADFGFARIKEENATMTRCGTPCWTAPEIIRGEKYDEAVDVFSFGVVMWQVLTRKEPFAGRNFMGVSLDVLEGRRPAIPNDCPPQFRKTMKKCWHANRSKRPTMESVVTFLDSLVDDDTGLSRPSA